jgi:hypothetical protein
MVRADGLVAGALNDCSSGQKAIFFNCVQN